MVENVVVITHTAEEGAAKDVGTSDETIIQCRYCQYFRQEPWETGYCRHTHMFVLETFSCDKFTRKVLAEA